MLILEIFGPSAADGSRKSFIQRVRCHPISLMPPLMNVNLGKKWVPSYQLFFSVMFFIFICYILYLFFKYFSCKRTNYPDSKKSCIVMPLSPSLPCNPLISTSQSTFRPNCHAACRDSQSTVFHYSDGRWPGRGAGRPGVRRQQHDDDWRLSRQSIAGTSRDQRRVL